MLSRPVVPFVLSFVTFANVAYACSVERIPSADELVTRAELIVRARFEGAVTPGARRGMLPLGPAQVRFVILEVLKGSLSTNALEFGGVVSEQDDPNDRPVPYDFVRPAGRHGSCFALDYRPGAEYLLMLARTPHPAYGKPDDLTPYWAPLAATNEQVAGPRDPWVTWIRAAISKPR